MRTLIDIPTIHDKSEYDQSALEKAGTGFKLMVGYWANRIWSSIEAEVENRDFTGVKIYAEGISVKIASLVARKNNPMGFADIMEAAESRQARLIGRLVRGGATLQGADSDLLLSTQNRFTDRKEAGKKIFNGARLEKHVMEFRDRRIASRINNTLLDGETEFSSSFGKYLSMILKILSPTVILWVLYDLTIMAMRLYHVSSIFLASSEPFLFFHPK